MDDDEIGNLFQDEEQHMTESAKIKLRLKKFCYVIGALLILWVISIIIVVAINKPQDKDPWSKAYEKAINFIEKLDSNGIKNLLNGANNIKTIISLKNINEGNKLCQGQIASYHDNNSNITFKGMCIQEGTTGVQFSNLTGILWQSEMNTAATFNKTLMYKIGNAQGNESKGKGINTLLSPCVNIMNKAQDGILWESFGENPYYSGICASEIIKGIQDSGVIATIKHFFGNNSEIYEVLNPSNVNKTALMDFYIEPFYRPIKEAQVGAIMVSNNILNKTYFYENEYLFTNILRNNLTFKGFIISDLWGIYNNNIYNYSLLDLNMNEECTQGPIEERSPSEENLKNKTEEEEEKESATRIIAAMYKMNQMENYYDVNLFNETKDENWTKIQREAATESQVLLRNEGDILPLQNNSTIAVIGNIAFKDDYLTNNELENKNETKLDLNEHIQLENNSKFGSFISPLPEIRKLALNKSIDVLSLRDLINTNSNGKSTLEKIKNILLDTEIKLDTIIVFLTATSDRKYSIIEKNKKNKIISSLLNHADELINAIKYKFNVTVVINAPLINDLSLLDNVKAVLFSGFPGDEASNAIADILFGEANPSGHLPFSLGKKDEPNKKLSSLNNLTKIDKKIEKALKDEFRYDGIDSDGLKNNKENHGIEKYNYSEGLYIDQRCSDLKKKINNNFFPFGFGLSYSSFNYSSNINASIKGTTLTAEFNITNNSSFLGQAVPMMFLSFRDIKGYSNYLFKGFEKVEIEGYSNKTVTIVADEHALSYFDSKQKKYIRVKGPIEVCIDLNGNIAKSKVNIQ